MRPWLALRKTMEAALEAQRGLYNRLLGERDREIIRLRELDRLNRERRHELSDSCERSEAELARLRAHFDATCKAKDEAFHVAERRHRRDLDYLAMLEAEQRGRLASFGIHGPHDWSSPLPPWESVAISADINGIRRVPVGLTACSTPGSNS